MKDTLVPIDKAGRIVLPKNLRDELAISAGDLLQLTLHGNELTLRPRKEPTGLIRKGTALVFSAGSQNVLSREAIQSILDQERGARVTETMRALSKRKR